MRRPGGERDRRADPRDGSPVPRERFVGPDPSPLFVREVGEGTTIVVLHGGPDFDHHYLAPDLDRLARRFRLVYYDQRGRGRSFSPGDTGDVTVDSEVADLDEVRSSLGAGPVALLGHSWGGLLAMEYATRHPERVSRLILMNTAPVSHADAAVVRDNVERMRSPEDTARLAALASEAAFLAGDPEADAEYYRLHFAIGLRDPDKLARVVARLRGNFTSEGIRAARAIESRLYELTWHRPTYDLLPSLRRLRTPTLVLHGDEDFVPVDVARRIADAIPTSRLVVLRGCGHFCFVEQPAAVEEALASEID